MPAFDLPRLTRISDADVARFRRDGFLISSCVFHAGEIWHGSGANMMGDHMRRSIGIHMLPNDAQFSERPGGYIYRRYQRTGDPSLDESYFPLFWLTGGQRTAWIDSSCETGLRRSPLHRLML